MNNIPDKFPNLHWVWTGSIGFVYEVHPGIVAKILRLDEEGEKQFNKEQFSKELAIYQKLSHYELCPFIVQCYHLTDNGIFLEYMRDTSLSFRIQLHQITLEGTSMVIGLKKLEPLPLRLEWMDHLTQAVAFLESVNLAHSDLRPENVLLDRNQLKLCDFDYAGSIGTELEVITEPYGRYLNSTEVDQGEPGTPGLRGARTEQFALGSMFYFINHGFEVYGERWLTENHSKHNIAVNDRLKHMVFPELSDSAVDDIIDKCWHNNYTKIADLAAQIATLRLDGTAEVSASNVTNIGSNDSGSDAVGQIHSAKDDFLLKKQLCQDMVNSRFLSMLSSDKPDKLGFRCEFYRYISQ
ncbi:hypothetical protein N7452_005015 [Penicillium brevicompactum]|uniref:Protein kinase domain-containing protein n=1 Tax=Penicillium brevicompactum TaxID=5074 RepID=A0A9W9UER2_PENBR|nr:hypothetical protein N7452_005015 [Penicillium brevicompactum]